MNNIESKKLKVVKKSEFVPYYIIFLTEKI